MRTRTKVISLTALVAGAVVFGMILAGSLDFTKRAAADKATATAAAPAAPRGSGSVAAPSFADIAEQVIPGVVSIKSTDIIKADKQRRMPFHPWGGESPFDQFFGPDGPRKPRGDDEEDQKELSGGTGFLIDADGYILTNNHVIEGAEKVEVTVGEVDEYKAKIVGRDPATDLALIKIEGKKPFPFLPLGDSDKIRVGEWVMAIGDPLNFDKTVTVGVVSGKGRIAGLSSVTRSFENLIQTDAAINFGNSGGPLVNVNGEVIGINTAISRFAQNIGFAVPINIARNLLPQLKTGKIVRGFLGIQITSVSKKDQEAFELKSPDGALVQSVEAEKPGAKAGLTHGDVIVKVDDVVVKTNRDLIDYVSSHKPGTKVTLTFIREGKEKTAVATLGTRQEEGEKAEVEEESKETREKIGISIDNLSGVNRRAYRIGKDATGVVVTHVKPVSAAADAGLMEGDVILEVNGKAVGTVDEYQNEMKKLAKAKYARFYVLRSIPRPVNFIAAVKLQD